MTSVRNPSVPIADVEEQSQRFADEELAAPPLGWAKEFWQIHARMVGTDRRLIALREAVQALKANLLMQWLVAADWTHTLSKLSTAIEEGMKPLDRQVEYISDSFGHLNGMVTRVCVLCFIVLLG